MIPLLNVIAGHLNLSNYLNELYTGTLPKTILNVGDISNGEMKAYASLLEQQLVIEANLHSVYRGEWRNGLQYAPTS